jgi:hypothetical protein
MLVSGEPHPVSSSDSYVMFLGNEHWNLIEVITG